MKVTLISILESYLSQVRGLKCRNAGTICIGVVSYLVTVCGLKYSSLNFIVMDTKSYLV